MTTIETDENDGHDVSVVVDGPNTSDDADMDEELLDSDEGGSSSMPEWCMNDDDSDDDNGQAHSEVSQTPEIASLMNAPLAAEPPAPPAGSRTERCT